MQARDGGGLVMSAVTRKVRPSSVMVSIFSSSLPLTLLGSQPGFCEASTKALYGKFLHTTFLNGLDNGNIGFAIFRVSRDRLKGLVMGSGKSHGTCHFQRVSRQAERVSYGEWQVPWDLPFSECLETG